MDGGGKHRHQLGVLLLSEIGHDEAQRCGRFDGRRLETADGGLIDGDSVRFHPGKEVLRGQGFSVVLGGDDDGQALRSVSKNDVREGTAVDAADVAFGHSKSRGHGP